MIINADRKGVQEVNPKRAMQQQVALEYLKAADAHGVALNQSTDFRRLLDAKSKLDVLKQTLLHYHDGDVDAANGTLDEVDAQRLRGKK
jgi:hypothetical protein